MSETIRKKGGTTLNLTQGDTGRRWNSFKFQTDGQERAVMLSSGNSHMWHPICELLIFYADSGRCVMVLNGFSKSWEHKVEY